MELTPVGIDIAKNVFQVHYVDKASGQIVNQQIKRAKFLEFLANRSPCLIGMEACGGAHHWARQLIAMGHQVKLMPARFVKAFNIGNKNDAADARAIWLAVQQPGKPVAVKTEMQQAMLSLHRMRQQLVKIRTMQTNGLRGLLAEYGEVAGKGRASLAKSLPQLLGRLSERLPAALLDTLRKQWAAIARIAPSLSGGCGNGTKTTRQCEPSARYPAWVCSAQRRRLPRWAMPRHSAQAGSLLPG